MSSHSGRSRSTPEICRRGKVAKTNQIRIPIARYVAEFATSRYFNFFVRVPTIVHRSRCHCCHSRSPSPIERLVRVFTVAYEFQRREFFFLNFEFFSLGFANGHLKRVPCFKTCGFLYLFKLFLFKLFRFRLFLFKLFLLVVGIWFRRGSRRTTRERKLLCLVGRDFPR